MNVLFVGGANTGRSPLAEALLRERLRRDDRIDVEVSSAGLTAIGGAPVPAAACARALEEGLDLSGHRARALDASVLSWADRVIVFEEDHLRRLTQRPGAAEADCRLLGESPEAGDAVRGVALLDPHDEASWGRGVSRIRAGVESLYRDLPPGGPEVYAQAVDRLFRQRTGGSVLPAPADFEQIEKWWSAGVPLWIVLEALRDTMQRTGSRGDARRMRRLRYCAPAAEERFAAWTRTRGGGGGGGSRGDSPVHPREEAGAASAKVSPGDNLRDQAAALLREAAGRAESRGLHAVRSLLEETQREVQGAPPSAGEAAERLRLHEIDERLGARLPEAAGGDLHAAERAEAEAQLAAHRDRMTPEAFARTVSRLVQRRLRGRLGVPDLPA